MSWGCYYWRGTPEDTWSVWAPPRPRSFAGGTGPLPAAAPSCHTLPPLSQLSRIVCKNICKMFAEQKHFSGFPTDHIGRCVAREWVGVSWLGRKQAISNNFHGWRRILGLDKKLPVKVGWWQFSTSLQVLSLSNTPGLLLPAQIREITHCYNFLWRWLCRARHQATPPPLIFRNRSLGSGLNFLAVTISAPPLCLPAAGRRAAVRSPAPRPGLRWVTWPHSHTGGSTHHGANHTVNNKPVYNTYN